MQFELATTVLGCRSINVDGNKYCSVYTAQTPFGEAAKQIHGLEVTKLSAEPDVFDQLADLQGPTDKKLLAVLRMAAGGKSQPYIVGVVPDQKAAGPASGSGSSTNKAGDK